MALYVDWSLRYTPMQIFPLNSMQQRKNFNTVIMQQRFHANVKTSNKSIDIFFNCMKTKKKILNNRSIFQFLPENVQHFRGSQNKLYSVPTLWFVVMISDNIKSLINGPSTHLFVVILKQWWWKTPCLQPKTIQVTR